MQSPTRGNPVADRIGIRSVTLSASNSALSGNDTFDMIVNAGSSNNLDFENTLSNRNTYGGVQSATSGQRSGYRALRIIDSGGAEQVVSGLQPFTTYTLAGSAHVTHNSVEAFIGDKNYGGSQILRSTASTSYVPLTMTFTTGNTTTATIFAYKSSTIHEGFFDDVLLFYTPTLADLPNQTIVSGTTTGAMPLTINHVGSEQWKSWMTVISSNATLLPASRIVVSGVAVNRTLQLIPAAGQTGSVTVTMTLNDVYGGTTTQSFAFTVDPPPAVTGLTTSGSSRLTQIRRTFATPVNVATLAAAGAISFTKPGVVVQTGATGANGRVLLSQATGMASTVTLAFDNASSIAVTPGVEYGSLADGTWQFKVLGSASGTVKRLFGDFNGDGTVDGGSDFAQFGAAFGSVTYVAAFDYDNNGVIEGGTDFAQFGARFGLSL